MGSLIGKTVDNYHVLEEVGAGGMGIVYKAKDAALDRVVALKVMDGTLARGEDFLRRFRLEARALARLNNPNIVSVFALREVEFGVCIVMEFVNGITLARRIAERGPLPVGDILPIFRQTLTALHHAHHAGIIHRDIKPKNIMLTLEEQVKITDFGLAKIKQDGTSTVTAGTEGTLYYMPPEQIKALANVDHRGDIYSLGMTLYECAAGTLPFLSVTDDFSLRRMIVEGQVPPPEKFHPSISRGLQKIIVKAIATEPADRYQSAKEMLEALEKIEGRKRKTEIRKFEPTDSNPAGQEARGRSWSIGLVVAAFLGAVLIGIGITWFLGRSNLPPPSSSIPSTDLPTHAEPATLTIQSDPPQSLVFVNGDSIGVTPIAGLSVDPGYVNIRVSRSGFMAEDTSLLVHSGNTVAVSFPLVRLKDTGYGGLLVTSTPAGASVWVDGERAGVTPYRNSGIATGTHGIRIGKKDYQEWANTSVGIDEFVQKEIHVSLTPTVKSTLVLQAIPFGSILVDGSFASTDRESTARLEVPAGSRTIVFEHPEYGRKEVKATVRAGAVDTVRCYFEAYVNIQTLSEENELMWGTVVINDRIAPMETPRQIPLGPGTYTITVQRAGYSPVEEEARITIEPSAKRAVHSLVFHLREQ